VLGKKKVDFSLSTGIWLAEVKASFLMVIPLCSATIWKNIVRDKAGLFCSPRMCRPVEKTNTDYSTDVNKHKTTKQHPFILIKLLNESFSSKSLSLRNEDKNCGLFSFTLL